MPLLLLLIEHAAQARVQFCFYGLLPVACYLSRQASFETYNLLILVEFLQGHEDIYVRNKEPRMAITNRKIQLRNRPFGEPTGQEFEMVRADLPPLADGEVLRRTIFLSLDPYMRGRMNAGKSYADPVEIGQVMCAGTVSQIVESRSPDYQPGEFVLGSDGWQEYAVSAPAGLIKLAPAGKPGLGPDHAWPLSYALGVLGMPGMTAYVGMVDIGRPKPGETVLVSGAAGAVGSVAGQIAKIHGSRVIGIAGSPEKCQFVTGELGFDGCIDYKNEHLLRGLRRHCPNGIDVYFDNVGGPTLDTVLRQINVHARIPVIGLISQYNATELTAGPNLFPVLTKRLLIQGMIVSDHEDRRDAFLKDMTTWLAQGKVKFRETVVQGLDHAVEAFIGLFHGDNIGKLIVQVGEPKA